MTYPKRLPVVEERKPDEKIYEISVLLNNGAVALSKIISIFEEKYVDVRSGIHFTAPDGTYIYTTFIDLSKCKIGLKELEESLKKTGVVKEIHLIEPKPLIADEIHFPLIITDQSKGIIFRVETFSDLQRNLEEMFSKSAAETMLYIAGKKCGERSCERVMKKYGLRDTEIILKAIAQLKKAEGWGMLEFWNMNLNEDRGEIVVKESFEADGYGKSTTPVCHFLRGYLAGVLNKISGKSVNILEKECKAAGSEACVFKVTKPS